jgi:Cdc6-like AAA superfamily ATPase
MDKRLLRIWGKPGVGKSALASYTTNYCQSRYLFEGGCVYINCDHTTEIADFYRQIIDRITNDSAYVNDKFKLELDDSKSEKE